MPAYACVLAYATICLNMLPPATICYRMQAKATICLHMGAYATQKIGEPPKQKSWIETAFAPAFAFAPASAPGGRGRTPQK